MSRPALRSLHRQGSKARGSGHFCLASPCCLYSPRINSQLQLYIYPVLNSSLHRHGSKARGSGQQPLYAVYTLLGKIVNLYKDLQVTQSTRVRGSGPFYFGSPCYLYSARDYTIDICSVQVLSCTGLCFQYNHGFKARGSGQFCLTSTCCLYSPRDNSI